MYSPALTRGLHGRAARCIWALVSQRGTHEALPQGGLRLVLSLGDCVFLQGSRCKHSTSSGPGPRASSAAAGMPGRDAVVKARG